MFDVMALAFQTTSTRIATFIVAHDGSNRPNPDSGIRDGHHDLSHHRNDEEKKKKLAQINRYHAGQFARLLDRLKATPETNGNLLDHCTILYGSALSNGDKHSPEDLPFLVAGRGGQSLNTGRHLRVDDKTPMTNFYRSLLATVGVHTEKNRRQHRQARRSLPWKNLKLPLLALACAGQLAHALENPAKNFFFGSDPSAQNIYRVPPEATFTNERGCGFEPAVTNRNISANSIASEQPFLFSVAVPEGNYRVTVTTPEASGPLTIKSESRRLMVENSRATRHEFIVNTRHSHVAPPPLNAPGNDHVELNNRENSSSNGLVYHWDDKLTFEFNGPHPAVSTLTITPAPDVPTIFLAGDSTVTDQPREPGASWGQMLPRWFKPTVAVANHAESGETLKSFITELRLDKILSLLRRGDYLVLQFGHNDSKANWPQTHAEAGTTYNAYLKVFIAEARRRGATTILVSPVQRRQFGTDGKIRNSHGDYPAAVAQVAREEGVPFIDLSSLSAAFYEALGPEKSALAFSAGGRDVTHHNNYGAYQLARAVVAALRNSVPALASHIVADFPGFNPAQPDDPTTFALAVSPGRSQPAPRGN
jgi:lysophospholipase L1-like esterase